MLNSKKVFYNIKLWAKNIFCSQITWWFVVIFIMAINPGEKLKSYIPSDWYLWFMLIFTAFLVWVIFKASHNCKKTSIEDIVYMGTIYSLGLFVCLSSPISNSYPEKDIQKLFDCLTSLGPLIVGFAAAFFACTQWKVTEKQHNLSLLEKRLSLKNKFENYVNNKLKECLEPEMKPEALKDTFSDLTNISGDAYLLFSKDISENIMQLAHKFEELKTAIHYKRDKDQGKNLSFYKTFEDSFEKDISKVYSKISHESAVLVNEMHLIMREGKI